MCAPHPIHYPWPTCTRFTDLRSDPRSDIFILSIASSTLEAHMIQCAEIPEAKDFCNAGATSSKFQSSFIATCRMHNNELVRANPASNTCKLYFSNNVFIQQKYYGSFARFDVGDGSFGVADAEGRKVVAVEQQDLLSFTVFDGGGGYQ